jgi:PAS domain S-box-containing protein
VKEAKTTQNHFGELRRQAEEALQGRPLDSQELMELSSNEMQRLIHELRVHQIELEMQNEELRRAHLDLEATRDKYSHLYDFAPIGYFTIGKNGLIVEANLRGATMLGVERGSLSGKPFSRFIFKDDQDVFYLRHNMVFETNTRQSCEIRLAKKDGTSFNGQPHQSIAGLCPGRKVFSPKNIFQRICRKYPTHDSAYHLPVH